MKNRRQRFLEAQETQVREIPVDLLMDIFSRVPATTVASCRCVSKLWRSIIDRQDFNELFLTMSWTRPRLILFAFQAEGKIFFFSSPQPQNPDDNSCLVPTRYHVHHIHSSTILSCRFGSPIGGFICRQDERVSMVICNPVTGESVSLPKMESKNIHTYVKPFLGYDPIDKQLKVLCSKVDTLPTSRDEQHHILTLENGKYLWRRIQCEPHSPKSKGICIDGILYYTASVNPRMRASIIVCFDVRSEKFSFINIDAAALLFYPFTLINYKGKLGAVDFSDRKRLRELWVLEEM